MRLFKIKLCVTAELGDSSTWALSPWCGSVRSGLLFSTTGEKNGVSRSGGMAWNSFLSLRLSLK